MFLCRFALLIIIEKKENIAEKGEVGVVGV
jgi:hypothetical protein